MRKRNFMFIVILIFIAISFQSAYGDSAKFTKDLQLHFTGDSSSPSTLYQDGVGGNLDVGISICDVGQRYVGACYALNDGSWEYALISYSSSTEALANANNANGSCYYVSPGYVTVSPSYLTTPNPDVYKAALPGNLWIGYDTSANPGSISSFIYADGDATLQGSYSTRRTFDETTRDITVGEGQTPRATFTMSSGSSFTKDLDDSSYGISSERPLVVGVCDDSYGGSCSEGELMTSESFPASYSSGLGAGEVNDQNTHTKYIVFNGMGYPMCIGANLEATINSVVPDPIYYSQTLTITLTASNPRDVYDEQEGGNVQITTNFDVNVTIYQQGNSTNVVYENEYSMSDDLAPDGSAQTILTWSAIAHSGTYVVRVEVDSNDDITECNEGDNIATDTFELKPVTIPYIFIDGVNTSVFQYPNIPYNLTFHLENSDGDTLSNASVIIMEKNGLSLTTPTQIFNITEDGENYTEKQGLITRKKIDFITDYYGNASFTFIPTYNPLYLPRYNYTNLDEYIGNYSLFFNGTQSDGEDFIFINSTTGNVSGMYYFTIDNASYSGTYSSKSVKYESMVSQVLDFIYQTFSNFLTIAIG